MVFEIFTWSFHIQKHAIGTPDVDKVNLTGLSLACQQGTCGDQLNGVTKGGVYSNLGQEFQGFFSHLHIFFLATGFNDLSDFLFSVIFGLDDE